MLPDILNKFNSVESTIDFSFDSETNNALLFLDIMLNRTNCDIQLKVCRKPANKNDHFN